MVYKVRDDSLSVNKWRIRTEPSARKPFRPALDQSSCISIVDDGQFLMVSVASWVLTMLNNTCHELVVPWFHSCPNPIQMSRHRCPLESISIDIHRNHPSVSMFHLLKMAALEHLCPKLVKVRMVSVDFRYYR